MPKRIRNFDDEIAWKERQKELEEEEKLEEILKEERANKGNRLAGTEEGIMQRCYFLFSVIKKYLQVTAMHDYAILVTVSSHSPFQKGAEQSHLQLPPMMPELMQQYLKSINYMDSCIGDVLQKLDSDSMFDSTIVVLTGDHTIFSKNFRDEFSAYCSMSGDTIYRVNEAFVPFVLGGKPIKKPIYVTERAYQMDIYPTIMHAIGCETFFWKGWGVNLMDSTMRENRIITSSEAFELADKVIRSNWFEKCCSQGNYK